MTLVVSGEGETLSSATFLSRKIADGVLVECLCSEICVEVGVIRWLLEEVSPRGE